MESAETTCDSVSTTEQSVCDQDLKVAGKFVLSADLRNKLKDSFPEILEFILNLQRYIKKQSKKLKRLKVKLKKKNLKKDVGVQVSDVNEVEDIAKSLSEDIKEAAELAMQKTGFVYEETSGLYYDYNTGYYYNAELGLYYNGNTGTYMTYNQETETYEFHSQAETVSNTAVQSVKEKRKSSKCKRKNKSTDSSQAAKRNRHSNSDDNQLELEEGECSGSSQNGSDSDISDAENETEIGSCSGDVAKAWPPCMRIIVEESSVPKIKIGTLHIITYNGGTIGREGQHDVLIPDINVSKHHLKFTFDKDSSQYLVVDLGSRNGTILNGKRVSASKQESEPQEVMHGSRIQLGSTILLCHIHEGNLTCGHCEPGLLATVPDKKVDLVKTDKNEQHKKELTKLRKKFGINSRDEKVQLGSGYKDRAQARRDKIGSQNHFEKTQVASVDESIGSDNKGFKLLSKMGWSKGQSLGKHGEGVLEPVRLVSNEGTTGIGSSVKATFNAASVADDKQNVWVKTQQRYQKLPASTVVFEDSD